MQVLGELDLATSPQFRQTVSEAQQAAQLVVLDLRELSFTDSSGAHVILDANRDAQRQEGRLLIARGPAQVDWALTLMGVCKQVVIFDLPPGEPVPALSHILSNQGQRGVRAVLPSRHIPAPIHGRSED